MTLLAKYNLKSLLRRKAATVSTALSFALAVAVFVVLMGLAKGVLDVHHCAGNGATLSCCRRRVRRAFQLPVVGGPAQDPIPGICREDGRRPGVGEPGTRVGQLGDSASGRRQTPYQPARRDWCPPSICTVSDWNRDGCSAGRAKRSSARRRPSGSACGRVTSSPRKIRRHGHGDLLLFGLRDRVGGVVRSGWAEGGLGPHGDHGKASSTVIRVGDGYDLCRVCDELSADKSLFVDARPEKEYYRGMGNIFGQLELGLATSLIACIGAMFSGMNTMYNSVARRTCEIGVLRAIGFSRNVLLIMFVAESLATGLVGGAIGLIAGLGMVSAANHFGVSLLSVAFSLEAKQRACRGDAAIGLGGSPGRILAGEEGRSAGDCQGGALHLKH